MIFDPSGITFNKNIWVLKYSGVQVHMLSSISLYNYMALPLLLLENHMTQTLGYRYLDKGISICPTKWWGALKVKDLCKLSLWLLQTKGGCSGTCISVRCYKICHYSRKSLLWLYADKNMSSTIALLQNERNKFGLTSLHVRNVHCLWTTDSKHMCPKIYRDMYLACARGITDTLTV